MKPTAGGYGNVKCHETAQYKTNLVTVAASREHLRVPLLAILLLILKGSWL